MNMEPLQGTVDPQVSARAHIEQRCSFKRRHGGVLWETMTNGMSTRLTFSGAAVVAVGAVAVVCGFLIDDPIVYLRERN